MTQTVLLGDICDIKIGRTPPRKEAQWFSSTSGNKWVSIKDMGNAEKSILNTSEYLTDEAIKKFRIPVIKDGTLLLSFKLTVGRLGFTTEDMYSNEAIAQLPVRDPKAVDKNWLYYYLKKFDFDTLSSTSSIATAVNSQTIKNIKVELPDLETQKRISAVLEMIDEKIELNRQINEILEQIGRALFRHYFIDNVETVKLETAKLSDFAEHIKSSVNPMKLPETTFHQYSIPGYDNSYSPEVSSGESIKSSKYEVTPQSILVSKLNPATPRIWAIFEPKENAVCSTEFQVIKPNGHYAFCYFLLTSREFTEKMAMSAGGTSNSHRRVKPSDILEFSFMQPSADTLDKFEAETYSMLAAVDANRQEIQTLTTLRDTLLPRLISGKIVV